MSKLIRGKKLALAVLKHIEKHPETWDQNVWHCGTQYCFAGHCCAINKLIPEEQGSSLLDISKHPERETVLAELPSYVNIGWAAEVLLGLKQEDAFDLFVSFNTLEYLQRKVNKLIKEKKLK